MESIGCGINNQNEYNWLKVLTRNEERLVHPLRHILFINFLCGDISKFFNNINTKYYPFGKGPWPCLNAAASHYKQHVVSDLRITRDFKSSALVGTFKCHCGFIYSRKGPDKFEVDSYRIGRIKEFGPVWREALISKINNRDYGLREIAAEMKCDPKTIKKFDSALGIYKFTDGTSNPVKSITKNQEKLNVYKQDILEAIKSNISRTSIRNMQKKQYAYIYKHDKDWLFSHLPSPIRPVSSHKRVDWPKRDDEIFCILKTKYEEIMQREMPVRITISSLGRSIGKLAQIEKFGNKMPKTTAFLQNSKESVDEFRLRRCKKIIDEKFRNNSKIQLWKLQKMAGIRNKDFNVIDNEIKKYMDGKGIVYE